MQGVHELAGGLMDPNALVEQMLNIRSDLDNLGKGHSKLATKGALLRELEEYRRDLRDWKAKGGFEPVIGWGAALSL